MTKFTKEQLIDQAQKNIAVLRGAVERIPGASEAAVIHLRLAEITLAALTAEPVAYMYKDNLHTDARFSLHTRFGNWSQEDINEYEITEIPLYAAPPASVVPDGYALVPVDMAPEMMRAVQLNSELGGYAAANLSGAYSLFREFWGVAIAAAPQQE